MKIENSSGSSITISRGSYSLTIPVGISNVPDYDWVLAFIDKNTGFKEYFDKMEFTDTGVLKKEKAPTKSTRKKPATKKKVDKDD